MRILHVTHRLEALGGAERHVHALCALLAERGHSNLLVGGVAPGACAPALPVPTAQLVRAPYDPALLLSDPDWEGFLSRAADQFAPDRIHLHQTVQLPVSTYGLLRSLGVPMVQGLYDSALFCTNGWLVRGDGSACPGGPGARCVGAGCERHQNFDSVQIQAAAWRLLEARAHLDAVVVGTEPLAELARSHGFARVQIAPYFPLASGPLALRGLALGQPEEVLCVARLEPEKGVGLLLEAFAEVAPRRPMARLHVVGDGSMASALEARAHQLGLGNRVRFSRGVGLSEVHRAMGSATLLAVPSVWAETLPLVVVDALHAGLPVVATRVGGLPFALDGGKAGELVEPGSVSALAGSIARLLAEPERRADLADAGLIRARCFDRTAHGDHLEALYRELGTGPKARRNASPHCALPHGDAWAIAQALGAQAARAEKLYKELHSHAAAERSWVRDTVSSVWRHPVTRVVNRLQGGPDLDRFLDELG